PAQQRADEAKGEIILKPALEGASQSGYARSSSHRALESGYATHRLNMRGCAGTEHLSTSSYHAGQTWDVLSILRERRAATDAPLYLVGFSLGGNVALKLAGELQNEANDLLAGVCAISTPIDLAAC